LRMPGALMLSSLVMRMTGLSLVTRAFEVVRVFFFFGVLIYCKSP